MKLYTKTGDQGKTSVIGGRVDKDDLRVEAYGTVDELNCLIGQAVSLIMDDPHTSFKQSLQQIQHDLFDLGVDLATLAPKVNKISLAKVEFLEKRIDEFSEQTPEITYFILPGGSPLAAALHVSRAVCRRAERAVVSLSKLHALHPEAIQYMNRLSDYLFAAARWVNHLEQIADIRYESGLAGSP
ncbi:cob(I)yrinic acid a,c-diamide adenosyltransferase [Paenibacillus sedimenti]|uniref:Corrinoid adenosyltransferase n=1 Tax=Paenibacillus sedimenti TaxID=2770274 RepID=A0A926KN72_9BACL|nr:cob(I)yrinic acid a,c-diamide adenosyltransferase [Paenibacillus sedimenti]MBD0380208.1 cob(I)yrinic acid a,c-diamide adenosyltransferase [Paenibacillus sedimenti]